MPMTVWLMLAVFMLMAWLFDGGRLLNDTRKIALDADIIVRQATQLIDREDLRYDSDPSLDEPAVETFLTGALSSRGYTGSWDIDREGRTLTLVAERHWQPGALGQFGFQPRTIRGTSTGIALHGIDDA